MTATRVLVLAACASLAPPLAARAQPPAARAYDLAGLQQAAIDTDPRLREIALLDRQSALRQRNIGSNRLPSVVVEGQGQYQSDVPSLGITLGGIRAPLAPPKGTVDSGVRVEQRLFDPTVAAQQAVERTQLAEQQAGVRTALFALRQRVNDAFFAAAALQARAGALAATIDDLEGRLRETNARVTAGTALPADAAAIEATLLQRRQDASELRVNRRAALARLAVVTGQPLREDDRLDLPDLARRVADARQAAAPPRARPEYDQFARVRDRLDAQRALSTAQERPRITAYGKVGYGLPGLNFINDQWETYGLGGVRVQWNAWTWGTPAREREALGLQQQIVDADRVAFDRGLVEATESDRQTIDRLQDTLSLDDRIVTLREQVASSMQVRLQEGVVTASDYLDREAELLQARFSRAGHQVELAEASARLLTTLGLEVR
jgi:outer membrane protein TolC